MIWLIAVLALFYKYPSQAFVWANVFIGLLLDLLVIGILKMCFKRRRPVYDHAGACMFVLGSFVHVLLCALFRAFEVVLLCKRTLCMIWCPRAFMHVGALVCGFAVVFLRKRKLYSHCRSYT